MTSRRQRNSWRTKNYPVPAPWPAKSRAISKRRVELKLDRRAETEASRTKSQDCAGSLTVTCSRMRKQPIIIRISNATWANKLLKTWRCSSSRMNGRSCASIATKCKKSTERWGSYGSKYTGGLKLYLLFMMNFGLLSYNYGQSKIFHGLQFYF